MRLKFLCIPLQFINLFSGFDFCNVLNFCLTNQNQLHYCLVIKTPVSLETIPSSSHPNGLTCPLCQVDWDHQGLPFPGNSDWSRDTLWTNEMQPDCGYSFWDCGRPFPTGLSLSCSHDGRCSLRMDLRGRGGAIKLGDTRQGNWWHHLSLWIQLCLKPTTTPCIA